LAFVYFKEQKVDFAVLETGLGGRLDATNVINPLVCAVTPISYEHTQKLGNTLREIAQEKAGIIKNGRLLSAHFASIAVTAPQEEEAMEVIRNKCKKVGVKLYEIGKDIAYRKINNSFTIKGIFREYHGLKIRLLGEHQIINASVAVATIEALRLHNTNIGFEAIRLGLYDTLWPGRCEVISKNPIVVLDGAQNIASVAVLKKATKENFQYKKLILVLGISSDKDIKGICNMLSGLADVVILTRANNPRATEPQDLVKYFKGKDVRITKNVLEARALSRHIARKEDLILVTGSLFVVGEFRDDKR
jgi:dihydrofolate synthase/folylpolyglutamate synthase